MKRHEDIIDDSFDRTITINNTIYPMFEKYKD